LFLRAVIARLPIASRGLSLLLNALMAVVIARLFGATASGEFFLAFAAINFAGMVGRLGADIQAIKTLPGHFQSGRLDLLWHEMEWLRRYCMQGGISAGVILALVGLILWITGASPVVGLHILILAISIPLSSSAILESAALRSVNRFSRGAFAETGLSQGLTIVLLLAITGLFHVGDVSISVCYSVAAACTAVVSRVWMRSAAPRPKEPTVARANAPVPGQRMSMLLMMGSSVLFFALTATPLFILGIFASARDVGLYNAATRVSVVVSLIPALQTIYLVPRVSSCLAVRDTAGANLVLRRAVRQASSATVLLTLGIFLFAEQILGVFGPEFAGALPALMVLLVGQVVVAALGNVNPVMSVVGLERASVIFIAIALGLGLVPMAFAAAHWGSIGVALVFGLMAVGYASACDILVRRRLGIRCFLS
jgi:O-antigen/teichoic acid export membrane protein